MMYSKKERDTDELERIETVGRVLLSSDLGFVRTATTVEEDYGSDITATTTANTTFHIEVKGLTGSTTPYWRVGSNMVIKEGYFPKHGQLLNKSTKYGIGRSKWQQFKDGDHDALVYYHTPTQQMFYLTNKQVVDTAYTGCGFIVSMEHTKEKGDKSRSDELKAFIDLDKAKDLSALI